MEGGVREVKHTYGIYDIIARLEAPGYDWMISFVNRKIKKTEGVTSTLFLKKIS